MPKTRLLQTRFCPAGRLRTTHAVRARTAKLQEKGNHVGRTMLADLRARAAQVCWCKCMSCTTKKLQLSISAVRVRTREGAAARPELQARRVGALAICLPSARTDPRLTGSRQRQDKRGRHRSATIPHNQLSWETVAKCGKVLQHLATCAHIKHNYC